MSSTTPATALDLVAGPTVRRAVPHVIEFDGLRGYLAWWVVFFHLYQSTGLNNRHIKALDLTVGQGWGAVPIFFILSGFVIALMSDVRNEPYPGFLIRRIFRLVPVYYLSLALGTLAAIRTQTYSGTTLAAHVALHLTMLHGLVPDQFLSRSAVALDFVAWSISVEWQFYLLAPFLLRTIKKSPIAAFALLAAFGIAEYLIGHGPLTFDSGATFIQRAGTFAVGMGSYYFFRQATTHPAAFRPFVAYMLPAGLALCWSCGGPLVWPGPIWVVLFAAVLAHHAGVETLITRPIRVLLGLPVMVWFGSLSYSIYLCHSHVLNLVEDLTPRLFDPAHLSQPFALVLIGIPLVVAVSAALHYSIERPSIALGKRIAARLDLRFASRSS